AKLRQEIKETPVEWTDLTELDGHAKGTKMTVKNLISYLVGWGELVLKWHRLKTNNQTVDFPETGYQWNELGQLAQKFYKDYATLSFDDLMNKLDKTVANILQLVEKQDNQQLYQAGWYKKYSMGRMIQLNTSSPYKNARVRIRKFKKVKTNL
ncbi:MAG: ClbS/DfsB family four-helix bundle protein, partial [Bacteroidota bacterium]